MKFKEYPHEPSVQNKSQRKIENKKAKRQTKNTLHNYDKDSDDPEEIYENFEKFNKLK